MNLRTFLLLLGICGKLSFAYAADYLYILRWDAPHTRTLKVKLETEPQTATYTDFKIPTWRPGRYYSQDYAASISHVEAKAPGGNALSWKKIDKDTWRVSHGTIDKVSISYHFFADKLDAGSSYRGVDKVYFNGINLFMYVPGRLDGDVELRVPDIPADWKTATALKRGAGKNLFIAKSYHELVDSPTIFAKSLKQLQFEAKDTRFHVHFEGEYQGNKQVDEAVIDGLKKICLEQSALFGGFPFEEYHFIYILLPYDFRHAVEHMNSTIITRSIKATQSTKTIRTGLFPTSAHEFWHVWNVKRIRPETLLPYDYSGPQYTSLHWFTEGVTDYFTHLTLVRTGIDSREEFYRKLARNIEAMENDYAATVVSPSAASMNSWLESSPYRHPFHSISYYPLGTRVGLLIDLSLRERSKGTVTLDDVFRYLYHTYYEQDKGVPENGIQLAAEHLTSDSWQTFFDQYVNGTHPIDYKSFLKPFGLEIELTESTRPSASLIGITSLEVVSQGWLIRRIHPGGDAYRDGLGVGDLLVEVEGKETASLDMKSFFEGIKKGQTLHMKVFSDGMIKEIGIRYQGDFIPKHVLVTENLRMKPRQREMLDNWLQSVGSRQ